MSIELIPDKLRSRFKKLTPIQEKAIPIILEGWNTLISAPTGSGKTEAAILPVLAMYLKRRDTQCDTGIGILYVTPLRALNRDMFKRLSDLCGEVSVRVDVRHSDTPRSIRNFQSRNPPELLITTPETLQLLLGSKHMRRWLKSVGWVIVDEVHSMVCSKRGVQLALALERLRRLVGRGIQFIGLSASISKPYEALRFIVGMKGWGLIVEDPTAKRYEIRVELCRPIDEDYRLAEELQCSIGLSSRIRRIHGYASRSRSTLIFANCREHVELLSSRLRIMGLKVASHHSSLSGESRSEVENLLKHGEIEGVVCTSSLELGIDIGRIDLCIQYLSPRSPTALLQRIGRSGHSLYKVSRGIIISSGSDDFLEAVVVARRALDGRLEDQVYEEYALDVLAHQIAGIVLDNDGSSSLSDIFDIVSSTYPYREVKIEDLRKLIEYMAKLGLIDFDGEYIRSNSRTRLYYIKHVSTIPEEVKYPVFDEETGYEIGHLGEDFYASYGKPGVKLILRGVPWIISKIQGFDIYVRRAEDYLAAIPGWEGEVLPTPFDVAMEVGRLRGLIEDLYVKGLDLTEASRILSSMYPSDPVSFEEALKPIYRHLYDGYPLPKDNLILIESVGGYIVIHVCGGHSVNRCIAKILSYILKEKFNVECIARWDAYRILLMTPALTSVSNLVEVIKGIDLDECRRILWDSADSYVMRHIALKFDAIPGSLYYKSASYLATLPDRFRNTPIYEETVRFQLKHHYDYDNFRRIIEAIRDGGIEIKIIEDLTEPTPIARPIFDLGVEAELYDDQSFKDALLSRILNIICISCLHSWRKPVRDLLQGVSCPSCGGNDISIIKWRREETIEALKKRRDGVKLSDEEERLVLNVDMAADLVKLYGSRAFIALSVRGVGPLTAYPILAKRHSDEREFLRELREAMHEYMETRDYWSERDNRS
ncbi:MAG: DEAD/DEAH box helicase [Candidatus Bathyarchaeia archaeon]|nr:DEAD/DEAH box helicase [Candidatus Bathyarchaeota archaeon]